MTEELPGDSDPDVGRKEVAIERREVRTVRRSVW